jgi:hypothetical protein
LLNFGQACLHLNRQDEAAAVFEEAFELARDLGYREACVRSRGSRRWRRREASRCARPEWWEPRAAARGAGASLDRAAYELHEKTIARFAANSPTSSPRTCRKVAR